MSNQIADDEVIARYLLGELSPEEQAELERRYFADPALLDRMDAVEDDLIDDYVRDELAPEQREHFESRFLNEKRLERVRMAEALRRAMVPRRSSARVWALPLAAALFVAALLTIVWLALENRALRAGHERLIAERERAAARQSEQQARKRMKPDTEVRPAPQPAPVPAPVQIAAIVLSPGLTRDEGETAELVLGKETDSVRLEALLEVEAPRYDVTLQRIDGPVVWKAGAVSARTVDGAPRLVLTIPRDRFRPGQHLLTVTAPGLVADYAFDVVFR